MKKFVFSLQSVYDIVLSEEKQLKLRLKQLEDRLSWLNAELDRLKEAYLDGKEECAREMQKGMGTDKLAQYSHYFESLMNTMILQKDNIIRTEAEKAKVTEERIGVQKKIKTYEKVRERQWEEYRMEVKKEEENEIGDLVSYRAAIS
ncbi:flagellar export protein FliJ [Clostridia bacterium OttesenSCG-928-F22]|nr:flagellar export protein FliJ [Clostridia bacterium OttesenSCG-928-F22]